MLEISDAVIINSILCVIAVSAIKLLLVGDSINGIKSALGFITQHLILQLIFIGSVLIFKGDYRFFSIKDSKDVYGISILNGIFGQWIFKNFTGEDKKIGFFKIMLKILIGAIPFLSEETKNNIIKDVESKKENKDVEAKVEEEP